MDAVEKLRLFGKSMRMEADNNLTDTRMPILPRHPQGLPGTMAACRQGKSTNSKAKKESSVSKSGSFQ